MISRQEDTAGERPFNNLLRRLNDADFALIEPHLVPADAAPNDLLYSPGDHVETVHFPCGPASCPTWCPTRTAAMSRPS